LGNLIAGNDGSPECGSKDGSLGGSIRGFIDGFIDGFIGGVIGSSMHGFVGSSDVS
jgi:hypothetical protein